MTDITKLRRELQFIEDSLKSQILTKEEYLVAKSRIEEKIRALEAKQPKKPEPRPRPRLFGVEPYYEPEPKAEARQSPESKPETKPELPPERAKTPLYSYTRKLPEGQPRKVPWRLIFAVILLAIALAIYAFLPKGQSPQALPLCSTDLDCSKPGFDGTCVNPGTASANCTFAQAQPVSVTVLTADCPVCDSRRMEATLRQIYPAATFGRVPSDSEQGSFLIHTHSLTVLTAYIVGKEVEQNRRFNITRSMLLPSQGSYVVNPLSSGGSYFFTNAEAPRQVELFMNPDEEPSRKALENIYEVSQDRNLNLIIRFLKPAEQNLICVKEIEPEKFAPFLACLDRSDAQACYSNYNINRQAAESCDSSSILAQDSQRAKMFYINTAPVFVFSNQFKKGGSLSPEILYDLFCDMNGC